MILRGYNQSTRKETCLSTTPTVPARTWRPPRIWYGLSKLLPLCTQVKILVLRVGHYFHNNFDVHKSIITKYPDRVKSKYACSQYELQTTHKHQKSRAVYKIITSLRTLSTHLTLLHFSEKQSRVTRLAILRILLADTSIVCPCIIKAYQLNNDYIKFHCT